MIALKWLVSASLTAAVLSASAAANVHCPGNGAIIRPRLIEHSVVVVPVTIDGSGPYDFVLDTAAQLTIVDPALASELHLQAIGAAHVIGAGSYTQAAYARPESLQTGSFSAEKPLLLIGSLGGIRVADPYVRGILGQNFLERFDLFIDYERGIVCLDNTKRMEENVKGKRIVLVPSRREQILQFTQPFILPVRVSGFPARSLYLELDSGSNVPIVFDLGKERWPLAQGAVPLKNNVGGSGSFGALPVQDLLIGTRLLRQVTFFTLVQSERDGHLKVEVDGLLPTALFRRVFLSYTDHIAVLEPW